MRTEAFFTERPATIQYMPLPTGEADLWLRKDITEITDPETGDVGYKADEAYMRGIFTEAEVRADFDGYFDLAAAWEPPLAEEEPSDLEGRIAALEEDVAGLKENPSGADLSGIETDLAAIKDELEAAKIILGVE